MKNNAFRIVCYLIGIFYWTGLFYFGLPLWLSVLFLPVLLYVQLLATSHASARESLAFEPIPETGYEKRLRDLDVNEQIFYQYGFRKFDEFYLRTVPDIVSYVYYHEQYPILVDHIHLDAAQAIAFQTKFESGVSLETSNSKNAGVLELDKTKMLQAFPERSFEEVMSKHFETVNFLCSKGFVPKPLNLQYFRQELMTELRTELNKTKKPSAPIKLLYRMALGKNKIYQKSIQEQHLAKTLALP